MDSQLQLALGQIKSAREYLLSTIADIADEDWFRMPAGWSSHVAWQVGHLAMAQYGLCLYRQRGRAETDSQLMPSAFRKQFSRGSQPEPDPAKNPSPAAIRETLNRIYEQVLVEVPTLTAAQLAEPVDMPYAATPTKLGALLFAAHHEMLHAGQLGVLRRMLGKDPLR